MLGRPLFSFLPLLSCSFLLRCLAPSLTQLPILIIVRFAKFGSGQRGLVGFVGGGLCYQMMN
jgi:hypothetical protein